MTRMGSRDDRRHRLLSREERVLWFTVTRSIVPLRPEEPALAEDADEPTLRPQPVPSSPPAASTPARQSPKAPPPLAPLGRRDRQHIARGRREIGARLDLHGMTQAEAHHALLRFLRAAQSRDVRLVLVITGKGQGARGERGVLRRQVPLWLALPEFRALVIGFEDAHMVHGGEGALYVRVRRARA